ncbi:unnamed protein product, partial [Staurois parvus]
MSCQSAPALAIDKASFTCWLLVVRLHVYCRIQNSICAET